MKNAILKNWTLMRFLRLGVGIAILVQAIMAVDTMLIFLGIFFTVLPVFNIGFCGVGNCYVPPAKKNGDKENIKYEEVV